MDRTPLATADDNARLVLDIYTHFKSRPGDALISNNFIAVAARKNIGISDLKNGLDEAVRLGWLDEMPNGALQLTARGFAQM